MASDKTVTPLPIFSGGMMRCCLLTLGNYLDGENPKQDDGAVVHCSWCSSEMHVSEGGWRWKDK